MRIEQITFTRFIAAISIIIYHYALKLFPFNSKYISYMFTHAYVGVSFFFILSGFVMVFAYGKKSSLSTADYFRNRFARIYPVYLLAILLILVHYVLNMQPIDLSGLLLNIFVIQAWIPAKAISFNSPGWSLTVEFFFYAAFPFLLKYVYSRYNHRQLLLPILLIWVASQVFFNWGISSPINGGVGTEGHNFLFYFPVLHLNEFLIGNIAGLFFINMDRKWFGRYDWLIVALGVVLLLLLKFPIGINYHNGFLAIIFVPIILLLSMNTGWLTQLFNKKALVFLGEISYGIYILQYPVFTWSRSVLKRLHITDPLIIFYSSTLMLILASAISYQYIETPLRNKIKNFRMRRLLSSNSPANS